MRPVNKAEFGARLSARRKRLGIRSAKALGALIGVRQQTIANIESGLVERPRCLRELAAVLATTEEWLLWGEGPEQIGNGQPLSIEEIIAVLQSLDLERLAILSGIVKNIVA